MRLLRSLLSAIGLLRVLENHRNNRWTLYIRSLFAIYDLDDMIRLDLPWWNLRAVDEIEQYLSGRNASVFEYGSGASTFWMSSRVKEIVSVESDEGWYAHLMSYGNRLDNVELKFIPGECIGGGSVGDHEFRSDKKGFKAFQYKNYVESIKATNQKYDLIVIDGRCRTKCLDVAVGYLKEQGMIVFDDTLRQRYRDGIARHPNLSSRKYRGMTATLPYPNETTLITHSASRLVQG
jgi:hypothetical protein